MVITPSSTQRSERAPLTGPSSSKKCTDAQYRITIYALGILALAAVVMTITGFAMLTHNPDNTTAKIAGVTGFCTGVVIAIALTVLAKLRREGEI